jgi:hypothetical protein
MLHVVLSITTVQVTPILYVPNLLYFYRPGYVARYYNSTQNMAAVVRVQIYSYQNVEQLASNVL